VAHKYEFPDLGERLVIRESVLGVEVEVEVEVEVGSRFDSSTR